MATTKYRPLKLRKQTDIAHVTSNALAYKLRSGLCNTRHIAPADYDVRAIYNADTKQDTWVVRLYGPCSLARHHEVLAYCRGVAYGMDLSGYIYSAD